MGIKEEYQKERQEQLDEWVVVNRAFIVVLWLL